MVKIDIIALGRRQSTQVFVVRIMLEEGDPIRSHPLEDCLSDGCLSRT
jgi:hypothetical protein